MTSRRTFLDWLGRFGLGGAAAPFVAACGSLRQSPMPAPPPSEHFDLVVIGTGFGGTMTALSVAYAMELRLARRPPAAPLRILMLERGTWWTTPLETLQDKQVKTRDFLLWKEQPTQEWSALNDYRGMLDLLRRCRYSENRPQGLYEFAPVGRHGLFNWLNDGVSVLRASGVGGGSLVYSKVLIRPPENLFDDPRWPGAWRGSAGAGLRSTYYKRAVTAISHGVEGLMTRNANVDPSLTGVSNILMRAPGIAPEATAVREPAIPSTDGQRPLLQIKIKDENNPVGREAELIDRARVFQTAMSKLTRHYGTADLSINDMDFASSTKGSPKQPGMNYCERHGRCNIGCLPGAGQTLNKQIFRAIYGDFKPAKFDKKKAENSPCLLERVALQLRALAEVDCISEAANGSYRVHYRQRRIDDPTAVPETLVISADRVIVAAGSLGTSELLLRSRQRSLDSKGTEGLHSLSEKLGFGFSPNGDHIALLGETKERVSLTVGPVTTSFGQFKPDAPQANGFHNIEDQGVPRSLAALAGYGFPVIQKLALDDGIERYIDALDGTLKALHEIFTRRPLRNYPQEAPADMSADRPGSEDELTAKMMCIVAQGKDSANGQFRLEGGRLRVRRTDDRRFHEDEIYKSIHASLDALAKELRPKDSNARFIAPLFDVVLPGKKPVVLTSHPLGGCPMGVSAAEGVVDEWGRVFRSEQGKEALYRGLYIADGSVIPTALGVNPSLTISALALRTADKVLAEWDEIQATAPRAATPLECRPA